MNIVVFNLNNMIDIKKDTKSATYIITKTDSEGFHHQLNVTAEEIEELIRQWILINKP